MEKQRHVCAQNKRITLLFLKFKTIDVAHADGSTTPKKLLENNERLGT